MFKRGLCILVLFLSCLAASAQQQDEMMQILQDAVKAIEENKGKPVTKDPNYYEVKSNWNHNFKFDIGASQVGLVNWAAGGNSTVSLRVAVDAHMDYSKNLTSWKNRVQMEYGFLYSSDKPWPLIQTNSDLFYIESKLAHQTSATSKWKYSASYDFRSQFSPGYEYVTPAVEDPTIQDWKDARILKSDFASPAYTNLALGLDWTPASWVSFNIAPLTGGFTIVKNPSLRKSFGMDPIEGTEEYRPAKFQFGAQLKGDFKFVVNKKFVFESQLVLFTDYLHEPYCRVNWDNKIEWQFARLFKLGVYTWLIYDPWVMNGDVPRGVQFKESVTLNFSYSIVPSNIRRKKKKI